MKVYLILAQEMFGIEKCFSSYEKADNYLEGARASYKGKNFEDWKKSNIHETEVE